MSMLTHRTNDTIRHHLIQVSLLLLIVGVLLIPGVSAETHIVSSLPYSDTKNEQSFDYYSSTVRYTRSDRGGHVNGYLIVELLKVQYYTNVHYFMWECPGDVLSGEGQTTCWYARPSDGAWKPAVLQIIKTRNVLGAVTKTVAYVYPTEWDIGTKTGTWSTVLYKDNNGAKSNTPLKTVEIGSYYPKFDASLTKTGGNDNYKGGMYLKLWNNNLGGQKTHVEGYTNIKYTLDIDEYGTSYIVDIIRRIGTTSSTTTITLKDASSNILFQDTSAIDKTFTVAKDKLESVEVVAGTYTNIYNIVVGVGPTDPTDPTNLIVYIKNSQTGALIANSNIVIDALVDGEYYPVVNRTEPSGIFTINLQPTGGGHPNPDGYRLIVTADGYNNPMPEINFTVDDYKQSIYCLLDPIAGGPVDENKTFIDFFVSDRFANPIPDATVKFGKYTLITNSAGYTVFEVPKNDYYTYTVSKSGYNTLTGNANIGDAPRNTINTYLTRVTTPPTQPPDWPTTPTPPTGGIPDEDDDSDGFLVQAVRGIGLAFGVGFSTAKIIFGMLLALSIGFTTAKKLRGGAAEFGIGLLGGTILGVLIGLLPVWIIVVLLLVVGLYVGNRYVGGNNFG